MTIGRKIDESFPSPIDLNAISEYNSVNSPTNSFFFSPISSYNVESIIDKMENKSSHIDTYSIRIVKHLSTILSPILCKLINRSFQIGHFPLFCKIARVVPIYKSGDSSDVNNYRPISILPIFSKIFEKIVYQQIFGYFQKFGLLSKNQFGFRKNLSTSDAIIDLTQFVYDSLDKGKTVISFFFDFTKAFDCVNHSVLLTKLEHYGIRGLAKGWFKSYLSNRSQCVVINGIPSTTMPIEYGVPQGSTLGPLLFLIFINDFPSCSKFFKFTLFADDSTLTCCFDHSNLNLIKNELETQLLPVNQWLSLNRIKVNSTKSNFMIFSYRKNMKIDYINFGTNRLFQVHSTKFLGIYIDEHLSFSNHIDHVMNKISKSIGLLFKLNHFLPRNVLLSIYNTLLLPYFNYGIILWHNSPNYVKNRLITAQKKAIRAISLLEYNSHTNDSFKDLGILKIPDLYKINLCSTMFKLIKNPILYPISEFFIQNSQLHAYSTRYQSHYSVPYYAKASSQACFLYQATVEFNNIPQNIKVCPSIHSFRKKLKQLIIDQY